MALLEVNNLSIAFGGLRAVDDVNLKIEKGELYGLIGPNGAGKTTVFNLLTGVYKPNEGKINLDGRDITRDNTIRINHEGIARTFQNIRLFRNLSVLDNVKAGMNNQFVYSIADMLFHTRKRRSNEETIEEEALKLLKIFHLDELKDTEAGSLPYGAQRKLEIARALASEPKLLLLDEPAAGMNPQETEELMDMISFVRDSFDICILLIEHDMNLVMNICERIYVLNYGMLLAKGSPEEIRSNDKVIKAYLGD